jgi:hypothetical protein
MSAREPSGTHSNSDHVDLGHSDLGPSSKDWLPGSTGRDEDFTPEKDLWTKAHKGDLGEGRPGEDVHSESAASADNDSTAIQPGTQHEGRSWQSRRPESGNEDDKLDQALKDSFPTSDPPQPAQPGVTGWDLGDDEPGPSRNYRGEYRGHRNASWDRVRTGTPGWVWFAVGRALVPIVFAAARGSRPERRDPRRPF